MFYVVKEGKSAGPFSADQLRQMVASGMLQESDLVRRECEDESVEAMQVPELRLTVPTENPATAESPTPVDTASAPDASVSPDTEESIDWKAFSRQVVEGGRMAGMIGALIGFIADFLEPLAPINGFLFIVTLLACATVGYFWYRLPVRERFQLDRWFPQQALVFCGFLLLAFGGWFLMQQVNAKEDRGFLGNNLGFVANIQDALMSLEREVAEIKQDTKAVKQTATEIRETTSATQSDVTEIKRVGEETSHAVKVIDAQLTGLQVSLQQAIGVKNLGPEYENTEFHRDYQNRLMKESGADIVIAEYRTYVDADPNNAMYRYLLSRMYTEVGEYPLAVRHARAGLKADPSYMWNRRALLYFIIDDSMDFEARLRMERDYYSLTDIEVSGFTSKEPADIAQAFTSLRERFRGEPTLAEDLEQRHLCWHLFRAMEGISFADNRVFHDLAGMEAVSGRNTIRMKIMEVRTGRQALEVINQTAMAWIVHNDREEQVGRSALTRTVEARENVPISPSSLLTESVKYQPIALRISLHPAHKAVNMANVTDRVWKLVSQTATPPEPLVGPVFGALGPHEPELLYIVSELKMDTFQLLKPQDFWLYLLARPYPWLPEGDRLLLFEYEARCLEDEITVFDFVEVYNDSERNLIEGSSDACETLLLMDKIRRIPLDKLSGFAITQPIEAKVTASHSTGLRVEVLGFSTYPIVLLYNRDAMARMIEPKVIQAHPDLGLTWPPKAVQDRLQRTAKGEWIWFTGTVLHNQNGWLFVVPKTVNKFEDLESPHQSSNR
jgi:hypothetical protein